jgi:hypothetical protein
MKKVFFIFFVLFTFNASAQFYLNEVIDSTKSKLINFDTLLTISPFTLDSVILKHVSISDSVHEIVAGYGCEGTIYYGFIFKNKKLIKTNLKRGIFNNLHNCIKPQFEIIYNIVKDNIYTDSNKTYELIFPINIELGNSDSVFFKQCINHNDSVSSKNKCSHKIEFLIKRDPPISNLCSFNSKLTEKYQLTKNLKECIKQIDIILDSTSKMSIKSKNESDFGYYSAGLRIWVENNWVLSLDSTLSQYFTKKGIYNRYDMSMIILNSYYRFLIGEKIRIKRQVKEHKDYWKNELKKDFSQYIVGDTVSYNFILGYISEKQETEFKSNNCTVKGVIISKNEKKNLLKIKLTQDCNNEGVFFVDIKLLNKLKKKKISYEELRKNVVKIMKIGEENWFYLVGYWKHN